MVSESGCSRILFPVAHGLADERLGRSREIVELMTLQSTVSSLGKSTIRVESVTIGRSNPIRRGPFL
jgi:hypothetical protein